MDASVTARIHHPDATEDGTAGLPSKRPGVVFQGVNRYTLEDDPMDSENHWLVEENTLPGGQDVRVYVSFRECK